MMPLSPRCSAWTIPLAAALTLACATPVSAQMPAPAAPAAVNPQMAAAQASFEALPEAERKAIQADLIWAGGFTGATSGSFGALTFRAINSFKAGRGTADGLLPPAERAALAKAAQAARDAAGFRLLADDKTGVRIGVPTKLLAKRDVTPAGGSRWQSADDKVTLDTSAAPPGEDLAALYEKAISVSPNSPRKITYKLLRPDFFVVTGETPTGKFYRRLASGPLGLRGFSIGYDKAMAASVDKLVIAIAGSFEPFPSGPVPAPAPVVAGPAGPASPPPLIQPPRANERYGVAVALSDRLALSAAAAVEGCRGLKAGGRGAKPRGKDANGLVLLDLDGAGSARAPGLASEVPPADAALVLVAFGDDAGKRSAQALPGLVEPGASGLTVLAPLQPGQAGSPAFDRQGRLVGLVTADPSSKQLVAGVAPQRSYTLANAAAIRTATGAAGVSLAEGATAAPLSTGAVVDKVSAAVLPLVCTL